MNRELEKIRKRSKEILGDDPERRALLAKDLKAAEEEHMRAVEAQEHAEDLDSYDKAAATVKRAKMGVKFAQKALNKLDSVPRMSDEEYMKALATCKLVMDKATEEYRKKAAALMDQLKALTDTFQQTAADTNETLINLDEAANVLQSRHPCREQKRHNAPSVFTPDKNAWRNSALRYDSGTAARLATQSQPEERTEPHMIHDSVLTAAWGAVKRAYPRHTF